MILNYLSIRNTNILDSILIYYINLYFDTFIYELII